MSNSNSAEKPPFSTPPTTISKTTTTTTTKIQAEESSVLVFDDAEVWDKPFTNEELVAIDAALESALSRTPTTTTTSIKTTTTIKATTTPSSSSSLKSSRRDSTGEGDDRPKSRRRLPNWSDRPNGEVGPAQGPGSSSGSSYLGLVPCPNNRASPQVNVKMNYPVMNFGGRIVYGRTTGEVKQATSQIRNLLEAKKQEMGQAVLGLDVEWRPSFVRGIPQGKAAVMQICGDMNNCYVLHIIHSGIPDSLRSLLEDPTFMKVGVGIDGDAVKVFHDHNVSIQSVEDLSSLANQKLGGARKQWSLASLVEKFTCKQLLKCKRIRLGNWEAFPLSKAQLDYAATDAFASWYLYEVLMSYPYSSDNQNENKKVTIL